MKLKKPPSVPMSTRRRRRAPVSVGLSHAGIVENALALIDRDGLETFSIRNLAKELDVNPGAIMWHIGNRNKLLGEIVSLIHINLIPRGSRMPWKMWLRQLLINYRSNIRRHPNVAPLLGAQLVSNDPTSFELIEGIVSMLERAGFEGKAKIAAYNSVVVAMVGFPTLEFAPAPSEDRGAWEEGLQAQLATPDTKKFPRTAANIESLLNRAFLVRWENGVACPLDDAFAFYVEMVISGLEAQLV